MAGAVAFLLVCGAVLVVVVNGSRRHHRAVEALRSLTPPPVPTFSAPTYEPSTPTPSPTPTKTPVRVTESFLAPTVKTDRGRYRLATRWTKSCTAAAKPGLAALLRSTPCTGSLHGGEYQAPNHRVYVQISVLEFGSEGTARRMARKVNAANAPKIKVAYGSEPGHWWSSQSVGRFVLIRQSFVSGSNVPGPRSGPAQTYGDDLIRMFSAELNNLYIWGD
ncbi:hypothetical protein [Actinomadura rayongensis]|uniref:Uncharacterized protein n=1 Tax=Actinomadura rayongensis TaxID=1429076 RepID=A0A6I4W5L2_9ACTN|nr:hypothetical protein [Actinomadura rayongensis]MXQ64778.1 hypothetical protein [Actinomadura rayongensis]